MEPVREREGKREADVAGRQMASEDGGGGVGRRRAGNKRRIGPRRLTMLRMRGVLVLSPSCGVFSVGAASNRKMANNSKNATSTAQNRGIGRSHPPPMPPS